MNLQSVILGLALLVLAASAQRGPKSIKKEDGKIVGGVPADILDFPYMASMQQDGKHFCGASLITPRNFLTAAHCLNGVSIRRLTIFVGATNLTDSSGQVYQVQNCTIHEKYNRRNFDRDIAVCQLKEELKLSDKVMLVTLDHEEMDPKDKVIATGWGAKNPGGSATVELRKVVLDGIPRKVCAARYGGILFFREITPNMICAGMDGEGGKDSCQGDSGGPITSTGTRKQCGIVSWGFGCAMKNHPGVYTNVANFIPWIRRVTGYQV